MVSAADVGIRAAALQEPIGNAVDKLRSKNKSEGLASWRNWLRDKADKGWRRSHRFTQLPDAWVPEERIDTSGTTTGDPFALFDAACSKFKKLWGATNADVHPPSAGFPKGRLHDNIPLVFGFPES